MPAPVPLNTPLSVIQRIVDAFSDRAESMGAETGSGPLWNFVEKGKVSDKTAIELPAISFEQSVEEPIYNTSVVLDKEVNIIGTFRWNNEEGIDPFDTFRYYAARLEKEFTGKNFPETLGGLCMSVKIASSHPQVEGRGDPEPSGVLIFTVLYRHKYGDPYKLLGET
jgi:hypothetical protein